MRELVLDTETTGLSPSGGDRIVSLGCVELIDGRPAGVEREWVFNPQRPVGDSVRIHGLTDTFLADKPPFAASWPEIAAFLGDARLVIHNAGFDASMLNAEFRRLAEPRPAPIDPADVVDTLALARRIHPGANASLDALVTRYRIGSKATRGVHGALKDARLLARVYVELRLDEGGGRQRGLALEPDAPDAALLADGDALDGSPYRVPSRSRLTDAERTRHAAFVTSLGPGAVWGRYETAASEVA